MTATIDATVGGETANSYLTLNDAQDLIDGMVEDPDVIAWASATNDQKIRSLITATRRLDREQFLGFKNDFAQALQWPRRGVRRPGSYIKRYVVGFNYRVGPDFFQPDEIPTEIKEAQAALAVYLNSNPESLGLTGLEDFRNVKIGTIDVTPNLMSGATGTDKIPPIVQSYLRGLRIGGPGNVAVRRA